MTRNRQKRQTAPPATTRRPDQWPQPCGRSAKFVSQSLAWARNGSEVWRHQRCNIIIRPGCPPAKPGFPVACQRTSFANKRFNSSGRLRGSEYSGQRSASTSSRSVGSACVSARRLLPILAQKPIGEQLPRLSDGVRRPELPKPRRRQEQNPARRSSRRSPDYPHRDLHSAEYLPAKLPARSDLSLVRTRFHDLSIVHW